MHDVPRRRLLHTQRLQPRQLEMQAYSTGTSRILRSVCRKLGYCVCTEELPIVRRRQRRRLTGRPAVDAVQYTAVGSFSSATEPGSVARSASTLGGLQLEAIVKVAEPCCCCLWGALFCGLAIMAAAAVVTVSWTGAAPSRSSEPNRDQPDTRSWNLLPASALNLAKAVWEFGRVRLRQKSAAGQQTDTGGSDARKLVQLESAIKSLELRIKDIGQRSDQRSSALDLARRDLAEVKTRLDQLSGDLTANANSRNQLNSWRTAANDRMQQMGRQLELLKTSQQQIQQQQQAKQQEQQNQMQQLQQQLQQMQQRQHQGQQQRCKQKQQGINDDPDPGPDFALASGGARIVSAFDTRELRQRLHWWLLGSRIPGPQVTLSGGAVQPGDCWAFAGFPGRLLIRLGRAVRVTAVGVEHVSQRLAYNASVASAPRQFTVHGWPDACQDRAGRSRRLLGSFVFNAEQGPAGQTFWLTQPTPEPYPFVELTVHSNHGNEEYTCLYRFRVHGHMA